MEDGRKIEEGIFSSFSQLAETLGYSPIHGKIIGALLAEGRPVSLQGLARRTGYSASMISLSLDLLELLGVVRRLKKEGDRQLYIRLDGDLLECLKKAVLVKAKRGIRSSLEELGESRKKTAGLDAKEKERIGKTIGVLESEIKRLEKYIDLLSDMRMP